MIKEIDALPKCNDIFSRNTVRKVIPSKTWSLFAGKGLSMHIFMFAILMLLSLGMVGVQIFNRVNAEHVASIQKSVQICKQAITKTFYNLDHSEILLENVDSQDKENIIQRNFLTGMEDIVVARKQMSKLVRVKYAPAFNYSRLTNNISKTLSLDAYRPLKQNLKYVTWVNVVSQNQNVTTIFDKQEVRDHFANILDFVMYR